MRIVRGRADDPATDRQRTESLLSAAADGTPALRVWAPPRQLAFGRRDARAPGFERAAAAASAHGFPPSEREVGGRAVAYTGETLAFAHAVPLGTHAVSDENAPTALTGRYEHALQTVSAALSGLGAAVTSGEPPESFCPGDHSIRVANGGKCCGIAQRVKRDVALVAGCLIVSAADADAIAAVTDPVYDALSVPFDPAAVGSVEAAGGPTDRRVVARALEAAFTDATDDGTDQRAVGP